MPCSAEGGGGLERTEQVLEERVRDKKKWAEKKGKGMFSNDYDHH